MGQRWNKPIEAVITYQKNKDYDIDKPINFEEIINFIEREAQWGYRSDYYDDFFTNILLMGARTTLDNELKISNIEALNYLMGLPLNFNLETFGKLFEYTEYQDMQTVDSLKSNFDNKKKLISQNFKSTTHIDVEEFLEWSENKGFITLK